MTETSLEDRASYVADVAAQLADMLSDVPRLSVSLRMIALEAALMAIRRNEE